MIVLWSSGDKSSYLSFSIFCNTFRFFLLFVALSKISNSNNYQEPVYNVKPVTTVVTDTLYVKDTVYVYKTAKPDTIYITNRDTI